MLTLSARKVQVKSVDMVNDRLLSSIKYFHLYRSRAMTCNKRLSKFVRTTLLCNGSVYLILITKSTRSDEQDDCRARKLGKGYVSKLIRLIYPEDIAQFIKKEVRRKVPGL